MATEQRKRSVKRKQAALRATSSAAASKTKGNGIDLGVNDLRYWKKLALRENAEANELGETTSTSAAGKGNCPDCAKWIARNVELHQEHTESQSKRDELQRTVNHQGQLLEAKSRSYEAMSDSEFSLRRELAAKEKLLTAALAEAEEYSVSKALMLKYLGTLHETGHALELLVGSDVTRDLVVHAKKIMAENTDLHADQLLQANTLKALREELKLAKKDATDWALNHEKEKRRADGLDSKVFVWITFAIFAVAVDACLLLSLAYCIGGKP